MSEEDIRQSERQENSAGRETLNQILDGHIEDINDNLHNLSKPEETLQKAAARVDSLKQIVAVCRQRKWDTRAILRRETLPQYNQLSG